MFIILLIIKLWLLNASFLIKKISNAYSFNNRKIRKLLFFPVGKKYWSFCKLKKRLLKTTISIENCERKTKNVDLD